MKKIRNQLESNRVTGIVIMKMIACTLKVKILVLEKKSLFKYKQLL